MNENKDQNYNPYHSPMGAPEHKQPDTHGEFFHKPPRLETRNGFELAALILGVLALLSCAFIYFAIVLGALAILFALLSRCGKMKLSSKARIGLILAVVAIVLSILITGFSFYIVWTEYGSIENLMREYCELMGLDFEALYGDIFQP